MTHDRSNGQQMLWALLFRAGGIVAPPATGASFCQTFKSTSSPVLAYIIRSAMFVARSPTRSNSCATWIK